MDRPTGPSCPRCGAPDAWPILYGLPGPDTPELAQEQRFVVGGCLVTPDNPTRACRACDLRWLHPPDRRGPEG